MADVDVTRFSGVQNVSPQPQRTGNLVKLPSNLNNEAERVGSAGRCVPERDIRVIIAEGETIFRESLCLFLQGCKRFEIVGSCSDAECVLSLSHRLHPHVVLLGYGMPGLDGPDSLGELKGSEIDAKIVLLCHNISREQTVRALQLGVHGIVLKTDPSDSLVECLERVAEGEYWLGKDVLANVIESVCDVDATGKSPKNKYGLTRREVEIIGAVLEGCSNPEIAANFGLSQQTVKHHISHIFDKLGVYSRVELALFAVNHRINEE